MERRLDFRRGRGTNEGGKEGKGPLPYVIPVVALRVPSHPEGLTGGKPEIVTQLGQSV